MEIIFEKKYYISVRQAAGAALHEIRISYIWFLYRWSSVYVENTPST